MLAGRENETCVNEKGRSRRGSRGTVSPALLNHWGTVSYGLSARDIEMRTIVFRFVLTLAMLCIFTSAAVSGNKDWVDPPWLRKDAPKSGDTDGEWVPPSFRKDAAKEAGPFQDAAEAYARAGAALAVGHVLRLGVVETPDLIALHELGPHTPHLLVMEASAG
jgi:hypothetical protein